MNSSAAGGTTPIPFCLCTLSKTLRLSNAGRQPTSAKTPEFLSIYAFEGEPVF